ncbi:MAG: hypothetical protein RMJ33_14290 [Saprospiraceae bacterium]|nr:hypothetical protein [Saprospiraceae bacterium]MDW8231000.1 hypothetical protein [Saprospiraceae bacterium]
MKKVSFLALALVSLAFAACKKELPLNPDPIESRNRTIVELGKKWGIIIGGGSCDPGVGCCIKFLRDASDYLLRTNEFNAKPAIKMGPDGTENLVLSGEVAFDSLSQEVQQFLLSKRPTEITEDIPVYEEIVREAYANSGLSYKGQKFTMRKGVVKVYGPEPGGRKPVRIKITITINDKTVTITIEW